MYGCTIIYLHNPLLNNKLFPVFVVINNSKVNVYLCTLMIFFFFLDKVLHIEFLDPKVRTNLKLLICIDKLFSSKPVLIYASISCEWDVHLCTLLPGLGGIIFPGLLSFLGYTVGRKASLVLGPQFCSFFGVGKHWWGGPSSGGNVGSGSGWLGDGGTRKRDGWELSPGHLTALLEFWQWNPMLWAHEACFGLIDWASGRPEMGLRNKVGKGGTKVDTTRCWLQEL